MSVILWLVVGSWHLPANSIQAAQVSLRR